MFSDMPFMYSMVAVVIGVLITLSHVILSCCAFFNTVHANVCLL